LALSEGTPTEEGTAMMTLRRRRENDESINAFWLEHRLPIGWTVTGLLIAGTVASAVLMLARMG
jgi:hypothetical protein